jgi:hypothetical protein
MLKEHDQPKEKARVKAERRWKNSDAIKRLKEERAKPKLVDPNAPPEVAEVVINDDRLKGPVRNLERKVLRDIRAIMEGHANNNLTQYLAYLERRRIKLLTEKLRRLKLAEQANGGSNV